MAETSLIALSKVDQLNGNNYQIWALKVSAVLRSKKLFKEVIEDNEPPDTGTPNSAEAKRREKWETKNDEAFGILILTLSGEQAGLFVGETKAKVVWDELKRIYAGNQEDRKIDIGLELKNIKMEEKENVDEYITRARNIASRSAILGQVISQRELVYHIVRGIHPRFDRIALVLRTQRSATIEEVHQALREEQSRIQQNAKNHNYSTEKAYRAREWKTDRKGKSHVNKKECYICGRDNHLARDCYFRHGDQRRHQHKQNDQRGNFKGPPRKRDGEHAFSTFELDDEKINTNCFTWNLDSGCTSHMTPYIECLTEVTPHHTVIKLAEEGREIESEAIGNVRVSTVTGKGETKDICINEVLFVPKLRGNLLSVKQLTRKGNRVIFEKNSVTIEGPSGEILAEPKEKGDMYIIETKPRETKAWSADNSESQESKTKLPVDNCSETDKYLWHCRMGHLNENYMNQMKNKEMANGIKFKESEKLRFCEGCVLGKLTQRPFKAQDYNVASEPLETVHMDICGPIPTPSLGGARYVYVIVDSYSRYVSAYLLKTKDEAFAHFVKFANWAENKQGKRIKHVRSDNGGEFVNQDFENYFAQNGIHHEKTVAYSPQSNGIAERTNRSIIEKARTLLVTAELPFEFWGEAVMTAVHLKNSSPTKALGDITPAEKWTDKRPNMSYLKTFGCVAYFYIPKVRRTKMQPKAQKGIFVGYSKTRKAYRIFEVDTGRVHEVRTVKFNEAISGSTMLGKEECHKEKVQDFTYNMLRSEEDYQGEREMEANDQASATHIDEALDNSHLEGVEASNTTQRGRKKGETDSVVQVKRFVQLQERENRLREQGARRSDRLRGGNQANVTISSENIPNNFEEAMQSSQSLEWKKAMDKEINAMREHNVWDLVQREEADKVIKSKWIFSKKNTGKDGASEYKARLVAVGCYQRPGIDFQETYAPVVKLETFRIMMAIAAQLNLSIRQFDVKTAYLNGELEDLVFMEPPAGYNDAQSGDKVCKLRRSIYGLPQSGRQWYIKFNETLTSIGLESLKSDPCVYKYSQGNDYCYVCIYVDDMIIVSSSESITNDIVKKLQEVLEIHVVDKPYNFLGIDIEQNEDSIILSQEKYVHKILKKYHMDNCNPVKTPGDVNVRLDNHEALESPETDKTEYQELLGSLMYLAVSTRPDICYCVYRLSQFNNNPRKTHLQALKRIYRYLKGTHNYAITYTKSDCPKVTASTDASWDSTQDSRSFSGCTIKLGNTGLLVWKSQKQELVALSTCEAELMALCECVRESKWVVSLIEELGLQEYITTPLTVNIDSKAAIDWVQKKKLTARTKHINRKYHFVCDEAERGNIALHHVRSEHMEADFLTKSVTYEKLKECLKIVGITH